MPKNQVLSLVYIYISLQLPDLVAFCALGRPYGGTAVLSRWKVSHEGGLHRSSQRIIILCLDCFVRYFYFCVLVASEHSCGWQALQHEFWFSMGGVCMHACVRETRLAQSHKNTHTFMHIFQLPPPTSVRKGPTIHSPADMRVRALGWGDGCIHAWVKEYSFSPLLTRGCRSRVATHVMRLRFGVGPPLRHSSHGGQGEQQYHHRSAGCHTEHHRLDVGSRRCQVECLSACLSVCRLFDYRY